QAALLHVFLALKAQPGIAIVRVMRPGEITVQAVLVGDLRRLIEQPIPQQAPHLGALVDVSPFRNRPLAAVHRFDDLRIAEFAQAIDDARAQPAYVDEHLSRLLTLDDPRDHASHLHGVFSVMAFQTEGDARAAPDDAGAVIAETRGIDADYQRPQIGRAHV